MNIKILLFFTLLFFSTTSCKRQQQDNIPQVLVNEVIFLNSSKYSALNNFPAAVNYPTVGWRGLLIFRYGPNDFFVFDRACTFAPLEDCHVLETDNMPANFELACKCCDSKFSLFNGGAVIQQPARLPLRQYRWEFSPATSALVITSF